MMSYRASALCLIWIYVVIQTTNAATFDCLVCTYTRSSDPTVTYECVNQGTNASTTRPCQTPYMCKTIALFNQEMSHIRSVSRDCLPQVDNCAGDGCCNMDGVYPLCEQKCRSNSCNNVNPEKWLKPPGSDDTGTKDGGSNPGMSVLQTGVDISVLAFSATLCIFGRFIDMAPRL